VVEKALEIVKAAPRVLVREGLFSDLASCKNAGLLLQIHRTLSQLAKGDFKGAGIKPLKPTEFEEAKINDGDRLLYTRRQVDGKPVVCAVEWCAHDDAARRAKNIGEISLEGDQGRWLLMPGRAVGSIDEFKRWLAHGEKYAEILLSSEQRLIVLKPELLKIDGSAGSGKTTVLIHSLSWRLQAYEQGNALYVTFGNGLLQAAKKTAQGLECWSQIENRVRFCTIGDLIKELSRIEADLFTEQAFAKWYAAYPSKPSGLEAGAVWAEIRGAIRGWRVVPSLDGQENLPLKEYEQLPNHASVIGKRLRRQIHEVSQSYLNQLRKSRLKDEADTVAAAMSHPLDDEWAALEWIIVDEVQDLTKMQIELLKRIANEAGAELVLAGDMNQVIYPTAFNWAEHFEDGGPAETLKTNYRCTKPIVDLSHQVLAKVKPRLLRPFIETKATRYRPPAKPPVCHRTGDKPVRYVASEEELFELLRQIGESPKLMVLARNKEHKNQLEAAMGDACVDNLDDYKGLEQETVFLYRFFSEKPDLWESGESLYTTLCEANRLYVAVTRARKNLVFLDATEDPKAFGRFGLSDFFETVDDPEALIEKHHEDNRSREEWQIEAERREEAGRFSIACAAYRRAGDIVAEKRCLAKLHRERHDHDDAGRLFFEIDMYKEALECFEQAKNTEKAKECRAELAELDQHWLKAAKLWKEIRRTRRAAHSFERGGDMEQAKAFFEQLDQEEQLAFQARRAARSVERIHDLLKALSCR